MINFAMNIVWDKYFLPNESSLVCSSVIIFLHPGNDWLIFFIDFFFLQIEQFLYLFRSLYVHYVLAY
jgi:hypothetical protein